LVNDSTGVFILKYGLPCTVMFAANLQEALPQIKKPKSTALG